MNLFHKDKNINIDELNKLEDLLRPQSVPNENAPKVPHMKPRRQIEEIDTLDNRINNSRPRAPIIKLVKERNSVIKNRRRRKNENKQKKYRIEQSLNESLESIKYFRRHNKGRELQIKDSNTNTGFSDDSIHFVNIEESQTQSIKNEEQNIDKNENFDLKEPIINSDGMVKSVSSTKFRIPELPSGKNFVVNILSTWGDPFYVGLMGIEIFDKSGHLIHLQDIEKQISADPLDLNCPGKPDHDPRTIDKLLDGHNHTCDELHSWLAPFQRGQNHYIYIDFDYSTAISMIRIWNYNTTRIHSYRGARYIEITLDGSFIFKGEIRRAIGSVDHIESSSECILFTSNETILGLIEKYDKYYADANIDGKEIATSDTSSESYNTRPSTGDKKISKLDKVLIERPEKIDVKDDNLVDVKDDNLVDVKDDNLVDVKDDNLVNLSFTSIRPRTAPISHVRPNLPIYGQKLEFYVLCNYGDPFSVGLTGIDILDEQFNSIQIPKEGVSSIHENSNRLFSNTKITMNQQEMWQIPLEKCGTFCPVLTIDFETPRSISALRFWNYNASSDETFCGAKRILISLDSKIISPIDGFLIRKAPGNLNFDFGQFVQLIQYTNSSEQTVFPNNNDKRPISTADSSKYSSSNNPGERKVLHRKPINIPPKIEEESILQQYVTPLFPSGCIVKFILQTTWNDKFYMGLNGITLYDDKNEIIPLCKENIEAVPRDINILPEYNGRDGRTLDKLLDGVNNTYNDHHMWLTPYTPNTKPNLLFIIFDEPITISRICIWNYSKTPDRGVKELEIQMDDVIIFHGILKKAPELVDSSIFGSKNRFRRMRKGKMNSSAPDMKQTILFTNDFEIIDAERQYIYLPNDEFMDEVMFIDNDHILASGDKIDTNRPTTSVGNRN